MQETTPARRFEGRRILVTGAASGIGRATATLLAAEGARLALLDLNAEALAQTAATLGAWSQVTDLSALDDMGPTVGAAAEVLGGLDGVANCAGTHKTASVADTTLADWNHILRVNLTAPFLICQAALPLLDDGGAIVNVASAIALLPDSPNATAYAASKGGLLTFSKAMAAEVGPRVRVNVVCPGLTITPMVQHLLGDDPANAPRNARFALRRPADPEEIARAILFLLSKEASYVTGVALPVDGGRSYH